MKLLICTQAVDGNHPILGFFHGWLTEFAKHFDEVHVICLQKGTYDLPANVFVYSLGKENGEHKLKYLFFFYVYFSRIFFKVRVDYVFFHMGAIYNILAWPFFLVRKSFNTKFYWWKAHGHINTVGKLALVFVDTVYTSTPSGFAIPTTKRKVVGQAIQTDKFVMPQNSAARSNDIIFVGRIMPVKRVEDFIETAKMLHQTNPSLVFRIFGPVGDEVYFQRLKQLIVTDALTDVVFFMGPKTHTELVAVYQQSLIFINTSQTQSMDKTVLESALCGCIPVTGNRAFKEFLEPLGLYTTNAKPEAYSEVIKKMLSSDVVSLQKELRDIVIASHSLSTFCTRIFNIQ